MCIYSHAYIYIYRRITNYEQKQLKSGDDGAGFHCHEANFDLDGCKIIGFARHGESQWGTVGYPWLRSIGSSLIPQSGSQFSRQAIHRTVEARVFSFSGIFSLAAAHLLV